ncbi:alpha-L-fucosidase [Paenibacillus terrigena]|uniref:alpha-L-fucosidase n=1 Tax=Paenibacillus terrigena TaxID=369333 RepID=UPI0028D1962D|nr:alpha-L-fucosidase [Paenibacillus terrigena]
MGEVIERARQMQPWLLSAVRTVGGPYENYVTPEQTIPQHPLNVPWESCVTVGTQWAFKYDDQYKSGRELVRMLMEVVSKGGNLALNVGPQPDGRLPAGAVRSIKELGAYSLRKVIPCTVRTCMKAQMKPSPRSFIFLIWSPFPA